MKTLHLSIIILLGTSIIYTSNLVFADDTNSVEIQNIQVQPSTIRVGDPFMITATLVNNSPDSIGVYTNDCGGAFTTLFDDHVKIKEKGLACTATLIIQKLNSGEKTTETSPGQDLVYKAAATGIANATVTFSYTGKNQTDPNGSYVGKTISKSVLFTILDNGTGNVLKLTNNTPLKQSKLGISSNNIQCKTNFMLIIKAEDGHPACVSYNTSKVLVERGWAKSPQ